MSESEGRSLLQMNDRLTVAPLLEQDNSQISMRHGESWLNFESFLKIDHRTIGIRGDTDPAFLIPSPEILGILLQSLFKPLDRLIVFTLLMQSPSQGGHRLIKIGIELQTAFQRFLCRFPIGSFESCFSEQERNQVHARIVFLHLSQ